MWNIRQFLAFALILVCAAACAAAPPADGLILWLDASDPDGDGAMKNNPADNAKVARWADKSSRGNHLVQLAADRQPTYQQGALNGRPALRFEGKSSLQCNKTAGLATGDRPFFAVFVMQAAMVRPHTNPRLLDIRSDKRSAENDPRRGFWIGYQNNGRNRVGIAHGDEGEAKSIAWDGQPHVLTAAYKGGGRWSQQRDGELDGEGVFGNRTFLGFRESVRFAVGQHVDLAQSNTFYFGALAEVLLYDRVLSPAEQNQLGMYLARKYSIETAYGEAPHFEKNIAPILSRHCHSCHGAEDKEAELDLRTVSAMLLGGENGAVLVRGFPDRSELLALAASGKMPPDKKKRLTAEEVALLRRWIKLGAPADENVVLPTAEQLVSDEDRQHWAFRKLARATPPAVKNAARVRTPVDAFVLKALEEKGLTLSPDADPAALARRAYFDLLGLPPTPDELDKFEQDSSQNPKSAFRNLISGLLQSPHFGERWGRHWLDAAGYVDVHGSDNDAATIKTLDGKWRYRDYVVQSFNDDKPFDRFLTEQLAGDELYDWRAAEKLTPEMQNSLIATGFLLTAADTTSEQELNTPDIRHRVLQETGEVVASNLLALTVQCAKCHNHKYEAIPQLDYYRWQANFSPAFNPLRWVTADKHGVKKNDLMLQIVYERDPPPRTFLLRRGNHLKPTIEVTHGLPAVFSTSKTEAADGRGNSPAAPAGKSSGRRLALARQLTDPNHPASALFARVMVNRMWQHLFGRGIVETSGNFGVSGARPTHPELLDWLAARWIESGWKTKPLIELLVTSSIYRQSPITPADDKCRAADPANRLLWRMPLRRLESEAVRDAILVASGSLDRTLGGPPLPLHVRPDGKVVIKGDTNGKSRRSIYVLARRNYHLSILNTFDQPLVAPNCTHRKPSAVVSQPLTMLNDEFVLRQAELFAERVIKASGQSREERIAAAFRIALARDPTAEESALCGELLEKHMKRYLRAGQKPPQVEARAMTHLCHMLLNTSEFLYVP